MSVSLTGKIIAGIAELMPSVRVVLGTIQVMNGMQFAFSVKFPAVFGALVDRLRILSLDFMGAFKLSCASDDGWDFYDHFITSILITPIFCGVALALYLLRSSLVQGSVSYLQTSKTRRWWGQICLPARQD